jgi:alpha-L-fucosidase
MVWFDGGADDPRGDGPDVEPIVTQFQPNCLFYHNVERADFRWGGSETGTVGYPCWSTFPTPASHNKNLDGIEEHIKLLKHGDPNGKYWVPAMSDAPLRGANGRHEWFWEPNDEQAIEPLESLMNMYYKSVGRNSTLILGLTPDPDGLMPEKDVQRLKEFGQEVNRRFSVPIASNSGNKKQLEIKLNKKQPVNHLIISEDIRLGERIRNYKAEVYINGKWEIVCKGESVGHKRIEQFDTVETNRIRFTVTDAVDIPCIKNFSVYFVQEK